MNKLRLVIISGLLAGSTGLFAQDSMKVSFSAGAGFTTPVGATGRRTDVGWNVQAGVGTKIHSRVDAMLQFNQSNFGINSSTLNNIGVPEGQVRLWSLTIDPVLHLNPKGHFDAYIIGGGGLYHRTQEFSQPSVAIRTGYDPYFGFYPTAVPVTQILASYSLNKPGYNVGMGISTGSKYHAKFFAEARYHHMFIDQRHTDIVPVTFGVRF